MHLRGGRAAVAPRSTRVGAPVNDVRAAQERGRLLLRRGHVLVVHEDHLQHHEQPHGPHGDHVGAAPQQNPAASSMAMLAPARSELTEQPARGPRPPIRADEVVVEVVEEHVVLLLVVGGGGHQRRTATAATSRT